jgi:phosphatidylserine/phosphatidylglycerophosphate/cardiolipin synthase-like enzyme
MTIQEWDALLTQFSADRKLSGGERSVLAERLAPLSDQQRAAFRNRLFAMLRAEMATPAQNEWVTFTEDVVKLLHPVQSAPAATQPSAMGSEVLFTPEDDIASRIVSLVQMAKQSIDICVFTLTDNHIADALLRVHVRGVRIRLLSDEDKSFDLGADVNRLAKAGIPTCTSGGEGHMHHKFAIFDRSLLLNGSYNWTRGAQELNCENVVLSREKRLIDQFQAYFDRRWTKLGGEA